MIRVDGFDLYSLGCSIHPLADMPADAPFADWLLPMYIAQDAVDKLLNGSVFDPQFARDAGLKLIGVLEGLTSKPDRTDNITAYERYQVTSALSEFEHVLAADLSATNIWLVRQKRGYDTNALIQKGWILFPPELGNKVPEAIPDIVAATQCIAFTLATAAAFHLHRANESVLHQYYDAVTSGAPRPSSHNLGDYLAELRKRGAGDEKVISALTDLNNLHRNPLIHPEDSLDTTDEAIALLGSIQAAITLMLKVIPTIETPERLEAAVE